MWCLGTWFSGGLDSSSWTFGIVDLPALLQPKGFYDSMALPGIPHPVLDQLKSLPLIFLWFFFTSDMNDKVILREVSTIFTWKFIEMMYLFMYISAAEMVIRVCILLQNHASHGIFLCFTHRSSVKCASFEVYESSFHKDFPNVKVISLRPI